MSSESSSVDGLTADETLGLLRDILPQLAALNARAKAAEQESSQISKEARKENKKAHNKDTIYVNLCPHGTRPCDELELEDSPFECPRELAPNPLVVDRKGRVCYATTDLERLISTKTVRNRLADTVRSITGRMQQNPDLTLETLRAIPKYMRRYADPAKSATTLLKSIRDAGVEMQGTSVYRTDEREKQIEANEATVRRLNDESAKLEKAETERQNTQRENVAKANKAEAAAVTAAGAEGEADQAAELRTSLRQTLRQTMESITSIQGSDVSGFQGCLNDLESAETILQRLTEAEKRSHPYLLDTWGEQSETVPLRRNAIESFQENITTL